MQNEDSITYRYSTSVVFALAVAQTRHLARRALLADVRRAGRVVHGEPLTRSTARARHVADGASLGLSERAGRQWPDSVGGALDESFKMIVFGHI